MKKVKTNAWIKDAPIDYTIKIPMNNMKYLKKKFKAWFKKFSKSILKNVKSAKLITQILHISQNPNIVQ